MVTNTPSQTTMRPAAMTVPNIRKPGLSSSLASACVAVTSAVLGNTKDHHVIWKGMLFWGRTYFQSEPTETRKNHIERPHSQRPIMMDISWRMGTAYWMSRNAFGTIMSA